MQLPSTNPPLPVPWNRSLRRQPPRRHRIGTLQLQEPALERFNRTLLDCDPFGRQLDADQIVSAARALCAEGDGLPIPASIYARMRCAALLHVLQSDRQWQMEADAARQVEVILRYVMESDDLIPHDEPVIGHLDDAILMDAAWPGLRAEAAYYLDYRRLRRLEADVRGLQPASFHFNRNDWLEARDAERRMHGHLRHQGLDAYRNNQANSFRSFH